MANKKVSQLTSKPSVLTTDLFPIADPSTGQLYKTTISDLGTAIGSGVSSVNGLVGAVVLDTDDIQELVSPTNKWFTDTRARAALSAGTGISYNSGTGVITNAVTSGQIAIALGYIPANDASVVKLTGVQTIAGAKTFSSAITSTNFILSGGTGNTGLYFGHTDRVVLANYTTGGGIDFETNGGVVNMTLFSSGNLGVGASLTDDGVNKLQISGSGNFTSSVTASSFIKSGGTSSQFLKADGSVDSTSYLKGGLTDGYLPAWSSALLGGSLTDSFISYSSNITYVAGMGLQSINGLVVNGRYNSAANAPKIYSGDETTGVAHIELVNTGGQIRLGVEKSTGGQILPGSSAYATVLTGGLSARNLEFGTNNTKRLTIDGSTGAATFTSSVTASSLIKSGGTSAQFLKADGSVDSNTYLTTSSASSTYLPLSGGTLTGALNGTSITLSSTAFINAPINNIVITTTDATNITNGFNLLGSSSYWGIRTATGGDLKLDVYGGGSPKNALSIANSTGAATFSSSVTSTLAYSNTSDLSFIASANIPGYNLRSSAGGRLSIVTGYIGADISSILVGTGTNNPSTEALRIVHSTGAATFSSSVTAGGGGTVKPQFIANGGSALGAGMAFNTDLSGTERRNWFIGTEENVAGDFVIKSSNAAGGNAQSGTTRIQINNNGNVGIGTTSPTSISNYVALTINGTNGSFTEYQQGGSYAFRVGSDSSIGGFISQTGANAIRFLTNDTERMRITSGGNVLIGTTTDYSYKLAINGSAFLRSGNPRLVLDNITGATSQANILFQRNDSNLGGFGISAGDEIGVFNSSVTLMGYFQNSNGTYVPVSDKNKKKDFELSTIGLNEVLQLKPTLYRMKTDNSQGIKELGFIAQEVKECIPNAYVESGDFIGLNFNPIVAALTKAVQELKAELDTLKNK